MEPSGAPRAFPAAAPRPAPSPARARGRVRAESQPRSRGAVKVSGAGRSGRPASLSRDPRGSRGTMCPVGLVPSSRPWPRRTRARGLALEGSAYPGSPLPTSALDAATRRGAGGGWGAGCSSPRPLSSLLTGFLRRKLLQGQTGNLCNPRGCGSPAAPNLTP